MYLYFAYLYLFLLQFQLSGIQATQIAKIRIMGLVMAVIVFFSQLMVLYVPFFEEFFQIEALSALELLICIGLGILVYIVLEAAKRVRFARSSAQQVQTASI